MHQFTYIVLDTETTGLSPKYGDRIVELAAVKIRDGEVQASENFSTLINPKRSIPAAATRVNKIRDDMVQDAPEFESIVDKFHSFCEGVDYVFIHNAKFDIGFLEHEMQKLNRSLKLPKVVCSVELSRRLYPEMRGHNLNALSKRFGIDIKSGEARHRALGDVILTGEVILKLYEDNPLIFQGTLEQLADSRFVSA